jgi:hypothetical protein
MTPYFKEISIEREFAAVTRSETFPIGVVGGSVSASAGGSTPTGPRTHHAVRWDRSALVFEHGTYSSDTRETAEWTERREVWSRELDGRLRVTITARSSSNAAGTALTLIYQRAPAQMRGTWSEPVRFYVER